MFAVTPQVERNRAVLLKYIPERVVDTIVTWIYKYDFKLKIKKSRSSRAGDYTAPRNGKNHVITVNNDLNKYAFLITLVHEIAHLVTYEKYKGKVSAHGREWKSEYAKLLEFFLAMNVSLPDAEKIFPSDIHVALVKHIKNPPAAGCTDVDLSRALEKYDENVNCLTLEKAAHGTLFRILLAENKFSKDVFIKGEKRRTRYKCIQVHTRKTYLVHALCKVIPC